MMARLQEGEATYGGGAGRRATNFYFARGYQVETYFLGSQTFFDNQYHINHSNKYYKVEIHEMIKLVQNKVRKKLTNL
jgi:hypothetical protein